MLVNQKEKTFWMHASQSKGELYKSDDLKVFKPIGKVTVTRSLSIMGVDIKPSVNRRIFALCTLSAGMNMINGAFMFYYVKVFLNIYKIKEHWFQAAQILFLFWNSINDPLFAYLQDSTNWAFTRTRRETVYYAAPLFALSFLVPWFPWGNPDTMAPWITGVHLITSLCFYDTMYTYVGLAYCCIFTEISLNNEDRLKATQAVNFAMLAAPLTVFLLQHSSSQLENFRTFQTVCVVIAVISCLLMRYCGKHAHTERELAKQGEHGFEKVEKKQELSYLTITKQILFNRDFFSFVIMNFFQGFHRTFVGGFFTIVGDQLIPKTAISDIARSVFYGSSPVIAKFCVLFGTPVIRRLGYFNVIRYSFILKIVIGAVFFLNGSFNPWVLILFMLTDSACLEATFSLSNLALSDIVDSDSLRYNRRHPVTSMIYGTHALVVKPAQSLSPMLVVAILNRYGYEDMKERKLDPATIGSLNGAIFSIVCLFPLILGIIQSAAWSFYTIRHKKTVDITMLVGNDE